MTHADAALRRPRSRTEPFAVSLRRGTPSLWATGAGDDLTALLGWGERLRVDASGPDRFATLASAFADFVAQRPDADPRDLVAFVTVTFSPDSQAASTLIVPRTLGRWSSGALHLDPDADAEIPEPSAPLDDFEEMDLERGTLTRQAFRRAVAEAVRRIDAGDLAKVVLARDLEASAPDPIDLNSVLVRLQQANPQAWTFHVDGLIGASPELLVRRRGLRVESQALAGSAAVTGDQDATDRAARALAASGKDHAEHAFAARSISTKLGALGDVDVSAPHVRRWPRIMHLATDITATLREPHSALDIAALLHPSAAVCGWPTATAASAIAELEGFDRGRYAGPVGWMDATGDGEFAIALRCGQAAADLRSVRMFAGGGIVAGSDPSAELAETATKFLAMYEALSPVARP